MTFKKSIPVTLLTIFLISSQNLKAKNLNTERDIEIDNAVKKCASANTPNSVYPKILKNNLSHLIETNNYSKEELVRRLNSCLDLQKKLSVQQEFLKSYAAGKAYNNNPIKHSENEDLRFIKTASIAQINRTLQECPKLKDKFDHILNGKKAKRITAQNAEVELRACLNEKNASFLSKNRIYFGYKL